MTSALTVAALCGSVTVLMAAYGIGRHMRLTPLPLAGKIAIPAVFAAIGAAHFMLLHDGSTLPRPFVIDTLPMTALVVSLIFWFFVLTLAADAVLLVRAFIRRALGVGPSGRVFPVLVSGMVGLAAVFLGLTSTWNALEDPVREDVTVTVKGLPAELDGLRLVQISDLHASNLFPAERTARVVDMANDVKADFIFLTGDLADGDVRTVEGLSRRTADLAPLAHLKASHGVFAVSGNHEYIDGAYRPLTDILRDTGIAFLENASVRVDVRGRAVTIAGVSDIAAGRVGKPAHNLADALRDAQPDDLRILLDHQPKLALEAACPVHGIDLQLSGHTHGGHTALLAKLVERMNGGFVKGLYRLNDTALYVSQGTGFWAGFPVRSNTRNELTVLTIKAAP